MAAAADRWAGPAVRDWAVAAVAVALTWIRLAAGPGVEVGAAADAAATVLAVVAGGVLAWHRRWPGLVAAVSVTACGGAALLAGPFAPVAGWIAVLALARHGHRLPAALGGATVAAAGLAAATVAAAVLHDRPQALWPALQLTLLVLLVAALLRLQSARAEAQRRERAAERARAAAAERLRIARDLHDLVGHGLGTIAVQSSAARLALDAGDQAAARRALAAVEHASRGALAEMRELLGVLRHDGPGPAAVDPAPVGATSTSRASGDAAPVPGLAGIDAIADTARAAGHDVTVHRSGSLDAVPGAVGLCAYRVVQEAVTNAVRHAPRSPISIRISAPESGRTGEQADELAVEVSDDGTGGPAPGVGDDGRPRYGLLGLRERVAAAGGTVDAGLRQDRPGWRVAARLPLPARRPAQRPSGQPEEGAAP